MLYSFYKLILTKEYRDHIYQALLKPSGFVGYQPKVSDIRDVPFQGTEELYPEKRRDIGASFQSFQKGFSADDIVYYYLLLFYSNL